MTVPRKRVKYHKLTETSETSETEQKEVVKEDGSSKVEKKAIKALPKDKDCYHDDQFEDPEPIKAPVKSIIVAVVLFVLGTVMLTAGSLMLAGIMGQGAGSFRSTPLMVIGSMIFIPGAYNVRTAYYAWKGYKGYSFADIAGFGEDQ